MRFRVCILSVILGCCSGQAFSQITIQGGVQSQRRTVKGPANDNVLTDDDVVRMSRARISDENIIQLIGQKRCSFDTSPSQLIELKREGVSDAVLNVMLHAGEAAHPSSSHPEETRATPLKAQPDKPDNALPTEVGLYYRDGEKWVAASIENGIVNRGKFESSVAYSQMTLGIRKIKAFATIPGAHSPSQMPPHSELLLYLPEMVQPQDYKLIPVATKNDKREFLLWWGRTTVATSTSSDFGGGTAIPFKCEQVSSRICKVKVDLTPGEFVLFTKTMATNKHMYTFAVQ